MKKKSIVPCPESGPIHLNRVSTSLTVLTKYRSVSTSVLCCQVNNGRSEHGTCESSAMVQIYVMNCSTVQTKITLFFGQNLSNFAMQSLLI